MNIEIEGSVDLKTQLLLAAVELSKGDLKRRFSSEELLIEAWKRWPQAWGLRGFERLHPDSHRVHRELDSRGKSSKGLVSQGLLTRVRPRVYKLTPKGLATASQASHSNVEVREKATRELEQEVNEILAHPVFRRWLEDRAEPKRFRDAGRFWRIAPGTPPPVIRQRIEKIENSLQAARDFMIVRGAEEIADQRGKMLYDKGDLARCLEFQLTLKSRFADDLGFLGVEFDSG